jgi:hypothetical protein
LETTNIVQRLPVMHGYLFSKLQERLQQAAAFQESDAVGGDSGD